MWFVLISPLYHVVVILLRTAKKTNHRMRLVKKIRSVVDLAMIIENLTIICLAVDIAKYMKVQVPS